MHNYRKIIKLYFESVNGFNTFQSTPKDFGTGDLLFSSEIHTLEAIGKHVNINLTELADTLAISKSGTSKAVKKLMDKALIVKRSYDNNKKEVLFSLTDKGLIAFKAHAEFEEKSFMSIFELLKSLEEDQVEFLELFLHDLVKKIKVINDETV